MPLSRREFLYGLTGYLRPNVAGIEDTPAAADPDLHVLNRISYRILARDHARLQGIGREAYLDEQLDPASISSPELDARLWRLPILKMDRQAIYKLNNYEYRARESLVKGALLRAVYSNAQLQERMVEFWSDHFNIPADGEFAPELIGFQKNVIRPNALGRFRDLLLAAAKAPAMLYYLDNFANVAEAPNENYARELLELHTLGVDGHFIDGDVKEVARAFTGWTVHPKTASGFYFDPNNHDMGPKLILGHQLPEGRGIEDGLHVLGLLANHLDTARFVCRKLCRRFVSDSPPDDLVDMLAQIWISTGGAIKPILRGLFLSEQFHASAGQKFRRPFDFLAGAMRATGTEVHHWWLLDEMLQQSGQYPYGWHPPNGYPDLAAAWINTSGLLARWNLGMRLTHGAASDPEQRWGLSNSLYVDLPATDTAGALVDAVAQRVFGGPLQGGSRTAFIQYVVGQDGADSQLSASQHSQKLASLFGLILASPIYQWR